MKIGDIRLVSAAQSQLSSREVSPNRTRPEEPADTYTPAEKDSDLSLMDPKVLRDRAGAGAFKLGSSEESLAAMEQVKDSKATPEELAAIRRDLQARLKELRATELDKAGRSEYASLSHQLGDVTESIERMKTSRRDILWDRIEKKAGEDASSTYETYFRNTNIPAHEMESILAYAKDLKSPDSQAKIGGNDVTPLSADQIWQTKINLLDEAISHPTRDGKPVEIDVEYYELSSPQMLAKLKDASAAGASVRVLIDPGNLSTAGSNSRNVTGLARRLNVLGQLDDAKGDIGVAMFANKEVLGGRDEIMHRKLFRVGDSVVFGGMNANPGSGENQDFAMKIEGPATGKFVDIFKEDVKLSAGATVEDIYGDQIKELRKGSRSMEIDGGGFTDLLEARLGRVDSTNRDTKAAALIAAAEKAGIDLEDLIHLHDLTGDKKVDRDDFQAFLSGNTNRATANLTSQGREFLADGLEKAVAGLNTDRNLKSLSSISTPGVATAGTDTLAIGDNQVERQGLILHAVDSAEKFVKVSAFVLNEDLAKVLVDKKQQMDAQGKDFEVQVVMDPGMYNFGGSPNEKAYKTLEDAGIPVKWSLLDRTDPHHDRKNHSKLLITDTMLLSGSTNFSTKGLRDNWELSDVTFFTEGNPESQAKLDKVVADFDHSWKNEAIGIDTRAAATRKTAGYEGVDLAQRFDGARNSALRSFNRLINNYEIDIGTRVENYLTAHPDAKAKADAIEASGVAPGYAILKALGPDVMASLRSQSDNWKKLQSLSAA